MPGEQPLSLLMVSGERSGDLHGAELAIALRELLGDVEIFGCGGEAMRRAGVTTIADLAAFAMVGITEVISGLPRARRAFNAILAEAKRRRPALAVLIDAPSLNLRLAKQLKPLGIPVAYYVSPQIWAWKKWRMRHVRARVDRMLCLFDFEEEIYRRAGVPVAYVGHPLVDRPEIVGPTISRQELLDRLGIPGDAELIALLPGSRPTEVRYNLPALVGAAQELRRRRSDKVRFILPMAATLSREWMEAQLETLGAGPKLIRLATDSTHDVLRYADAAAVASGTATLETALLGCPMVVVYRVAASTAFLARFMLDVKYYSMVNLLAGRAVVNELIQEDFTPQRVAGEIERLLDDSYLRRRMLSGYEEVRARLGNGGAAGRAACEIAGMLGRLAPVEVAPARR